MRLRGLVALVALAGAFALPGVALAAFHLVEIEQVIGGVNGDTSAQAVQLRLRLGGNNLFNNQVRLRAWDAAGANPVTLINFTGPNPLSGLACRRILVATPNFQFTTTPRLYPTLETDYVMSTPIPASYLAAGSLTFENTAGTQTYWRISWGGASYTGVGTVSVTPTGPDLDGTMNPPFGSALPSSGLTALLLTSACNAPPSDNATQYAVTPGAAVFTANDTNTFTVTAPASSPVPILPSSSGLWFVVALGAVTGAAAVLRRRSA